MAGNKLLEPKPSGSWSHHLYHRDLQVMWKWASPAETWHRGPPLDRLRGLLRSSCLESRMAAKCKGESVSFWVPVPVSECTRWTLSFKYILSQGLFRTYLCYNFNNTGGQSIFFFELDGPSAHFIQWPLNKCYFLDAITKLLLYALLDYIFKTFSAFFKMTYNFKSDKITYLTHLLRLFFKFSLLV